MKMTDDEKRQIEMAIAAVEQQGEGEIVLLVAPSSHFYGWVHAFWALIGWLVCSGGLGLLFSLTGLTLSLPRIVFWQIFGANVFALLSFVPFVKRITIPRKRLAAAVLHAARANFFTASQDVNPARPRVYLYISSFESLVVVDGDARVRARTKVDFWETESRQLSAHLSGKQWLVTLLRSIAQMGDLFEERAPERAPEAPEEGSRLYH